MEKEKEEENVKDTYVRRRASSPTELISYRVLIFQYPVQS